MNKLIKRIWEHEIRIHEGEVAFWEVGENGLKKMGFAKLEEDGRIFFSEGLPERARSIARDKLKKIEKNQFQRIP